MKRYVSERESGRVVLVLFARAQGRKLHVAVMREADVLLTLPVATERDVSSINHQVKQSQNYLITANGYSSMLINSQARFSCHCDGPEFLPRCG